MSSNALIKRLAMSAVLLLPFGANAALIDGSGFISTGAEGPTTIDEWYFSVTVAGNFEILTESESSDFLDSEINLYTAAGDFIENDDDGWTDQRSSFIDRFLDAGDYVLYVSAFSFDPGQQGGATHDNGPLDEVGTIQNQGDYFLSIDGTGAANLTMLREGNLDGSFTVTTATAVPAPGTLALLGIGVLALRRRRKTA